MKKLFFFCLVTCSAFGSQLTDYEQEVACNPHDYRALYNVGVEAFKKDDLQKAQAAFNCVKTFCQEGAWDDARCEQVYYNAGNTEMKLQAYADAVESFGVVLDYNPDNEKAREKLELAKKLLEQQQKEEEQKEDQDSQDQEKQDSDQGEQNQDQKEQNEDDSQGDQDQQQQNRDAQENKKNDEEHQQDGQQGEDEEPQDNQQLNQGDGDEQSDNQESGQDEKSGPELSEQEQQLMAALQAHDEEMSKEMGQRMLRGVAGAYGQNNW